MTVFYQLQCNLVYQRVLDYCFPSGHPRHSWTTARGHTLFTDTYRRESTHVPNGSGLCECAHVKSLYETSIVSRIMNRYVQCSSHLFSYPATGAVTCVHTQLRATVTRTMPSIDPSSMESMRSAKSLHVCNARRSRDILRWSCIVYLPMLCRLLVRSHKGARKTFTCAIYARGT